MSDLVDDHRGMTPARKKHIQDHRRKADLYGPNLPFSFSKPKKGKPNNIEVVCECGRYVFVNKDTYMVICPSCQAIIKC